MINLNDLYKEFFARTINCGVALPAEIKEIAQQIYSLQSSASSVSAYKDKKLNELEKFAEQMQAHADSCGFAKSDDWKNLYSDYAEYMNVHHSVFERFVKIMQPLCKSKCFSLSGLEYTKNNLLYWIYVDGQITIDDWTHFVLSNPAEKYAFYHLSNLYVNKGGKISDSDYDVITYCIRNGKYPETFAGIH